MHLRIPERITRERIILEPCHAYGVCGGVLLLSPGPLTNRGVVIVVVVITQTCLVRGNIMGVIHVVFRVVFVVTEVERRSGIRVIGVRMIECILGNG